MRNDEVLIAWKAGDTVSKWNNHCAMIVEHFGLPGDRFTTEVCADWMSFKFNDEKDAFLCKIMLSEHLGH
jgi:hypothetical protein